MMKKSNFVIKLVSLMFAGIMVLGCVCSCAEPDAGEAQNTSDNDQTTTENAVTTTVATTAAGTLPSDLGFDGQSAKILYWSDVINDEFAIAEDKQDRISSAIRSKDEYVQELLDVEIEWVGTEGNKAKLSNFKKRVEADVQANDSEIVAGHSMVVGALAAAGLLQDLIQTEYLNFENPWWPDDLIENSTVNGKLYFCSGDISNNTLFGMIGMFFNKDMVETDVYSLVTSGQWTLTRLIKETENLYSDNDSDGKDTNDTFGYTSYSGMVNPLFIGMGIRIIDKNADGNMILSDSYVSEKTEMILGKLNECFYSSNDWIYCSKIAECTKMFTESRAAFYSASVRLTVNSLGNTDVKYGILPNPKYNDSQEEYYTLMANTYTMYGITKNIVDTDKSSAIIEALAQEGYKKVTPEVFEVALKSRYSEATEDAKMFDLLRDTTVFEIGLIFSDQIGKYPSTALFNRVDAKQSTWIAYMAGKTSLIDGYLETLNTSDAFKK